MTRKADDSTYSFQVFAIYNTNLALPSEEERKEFASELDLCGLGQSVLPEPNKAQRRVLLEQSTRYIRR